MVSSEEIVERSMYMNLLSVALAAGVTLDPDDYLDENGNPTPQSEAQWNTDKKALSKFVYIFGVGNNQERGIKEVPRITLDLQGYYPGVIGMERYQVDDTIKHNPRMIETGYTTKEIVIDVHLVSKTQADMRLLHSIMYKALPSQGYIKPYFNDKEAFFNGGLLPSENIYLEVGNYYDHADTGHGLLEHVYQYKVSDGVVPDEVVNMDLVPIRDITCLIGIKDKPVPGSSNIEAIIHIPEEAINSISVNLSVGVNSYITPIPIDFSKTEGITAYIWDGTRPDQQTVLLTKVDAVPKNTPVLIVSTLESVILYRAEEEPATSNCILRYALPNLDYNTVFIPTVNETTRDLEFIYYETYQSENFYTYIDMSDLAAAPTTVLVEYSL